MDYQPGQPYENKKRPHYRKITWPEEKGGVLNIIEIFFLFL